MPDIFASNVKTELQNIENRFGSLVFYCISYSTVIIFQILQVKRQQFGDNNCLLSRIVQTSYHRINASSTVGQVITRHKPTPFFGNMH